MPAWTGNDNDRPPASLLLQPWLFKHSCCHASAHFLFRRPCGSLRAASAAIVGCRFMPSYASREGRFTSSDSPRALSRLRAGRLTGQAC